MIVQSLTGWTKSGLQGGGTSFSASEKNGSRKPFREPFLIFQKPLTALGQYTVVGSPAVAEPLSLSNRTLNSPRPGSTPRTVNNHEARAPGGRLDTG